MSEEQVDGWDKRSGQKRKIQDKSIEVDFWTPQSLVDSLAAVYGPFDLDAAASSINTKATKYFTKDDNALTKSWQGRVWCNPPYGRTTNTSQGTSAWISKAIEETKTSLHADVVVMLVPCYTDLAFFHTHVLPNVDEIIFIRSRVKFEGPNICDNGTSRNPSAIYIFRKGTRNSGSIKIGQCYRTGEQFVAPV